MEPEAGADALEVNLYAVQADPRLDAAAVEARLETLNTEVTIRGGFADLNGSNGTRYLIGGDVRTQVLTYSESFPLDGALTLGLGANIGDGNDAYYIPIGLSLGRRFNLEGSNTTFVPYAHPVLVPRFGGGDSSVDAALGLGVDIRFSEDLALRVSGGIGDIEGVGISLAYIH